MRLEALQMMRESLKARRTLNVKAEWGMRLVDHPYEASK